MKKLISVLLMCALTAGVTGCGGSSDASNSATSDNASGNSQETETSSDDETTPENTYLIGISQFAQHGSLDNCYEGILIGLEDYGLSIDKDFSVIFENAGSDMGMATQIAQNFSAQNVDVMVAIATPSATASFAAAEDKDIPVVFTAITDPVEAKLDSGNITGTSDKLPVEEQLKLIRLMQPDADTIGIIYTTSEPNSVSAIREYEEIVGDYGFTLETIGVTQQSEVVMATDTMIAKGVDALSNLTDNTVVDVLPSILEKTSDAGIPVYGSEVEQVSIGCIAAAGIDYIDLGIQTGGMIGQILTGEKEASDIPYETISESSVTLNLAVAEELGVEISEDVMNMATIINE